MTGQRVNRRSLLLGLALAPAVARAARAAPMTLRLSSSLPNNPQFANGRVHYDNLVKRLAADGLADRIDVQFFPTISSARRSTSSTRSVSVSSISWSPAPRSGRMSCP
jgi:hypothetical protein